MSDGSINPRFVDEVVAGLSDDHRRAVLALDEFYGRGPAYLAAECGWPLPYGRSVLRDLEREGVCVFTPLFSEDDGLTRGSGYWLESFGHAVRDKIEEASA